MNKKKKLTYVSPCIELIHIENEGVIAGSATLGGFGNGGNWGKSAPSPQGRRSSYGGTPATTNDIEEMLEELFTVEQ